MPRYRSKPAERLRSKKLDELQGLLANFDDEELLVARGLCLHEAARRRGYCDSPARQLDNKRFAYIMALDEADLTCREETGVPLRSMPEYERYKRMCDPVGSTISRFFNGWGAALHEAGLLSLEQPEAKLTKPPGRTADAKDWSDEECRIAAALCFDRYAGRRFSGTMYECFRDESGERLPGYQSLRDVLAGGKGQGAWDVVMQAGIDWVLAHSDDFPAAHRYLARAKGLRG